MTNEDFSIEFLHQRRYCHKIFTNDTIFYMQYEYIKLKRVELDDYLANDAHIHLSHCEIFKVKFSILQKTAV